jgi:phosphoenolpyruvate-protein kinase (PTS system EI component)
MAEASLQGLPGSPGLAVGRARVLGGAAVSRETVPEARRPLEVERAHAALEAAAAELDALAERVGGDEAEIIRAGVLMAHDPVLVDDVERAVLGGLPAAAALEAGTTRHAAAIAALDDATLAARAEDVRSLGRRAIQTLEKGSGGRDGVRVEGSDPFIAAPGSDATVKGSDPFAAAQDVVLVAPELGPADVAELGPEVVGLALAGGGPTAHAAVVARGLGLPMVVGLGEEVLGATPGEPIVVDGGEGVAIVVPSAARAEAAAAAQAARRAERERGLADRELPAVTRDGHRVRVLVNAATRAELDAGLAAGAEGVGLLRTELAFLEAAEWPTEADHRAAIAPVLSGLAGRTATVRVLDFGADKTPPLLAGTRERGLELLLARPEALAAQLRAILDTGRATELRILLPMVESAEQVRAVRALLPEPASLGAMIETRAAVADAPAIAAAADFLSIGTNDLSHAVLGSDRFGGGAAPAHDPRVLAAIAATARAAAAARKTLEVCGEAASEPASVPLLVGLGAGELSVGAARVGAVRGWIRALRSDEAHSAAQAALAARDQDDAAAIGRAALLQRGDAAGQRVERDGRVVAVGPEA